MKYPTWLKRAFIGSLGLFVALNIFYLLGASGVLVGTSAIDFARDFDYQLYKITDDTGFAVEDDSVSVVNITEGFILFRPMCGTYQTDGIVMPLADYRKGDWLYTEYPDLTDVDALNLQNGETKDIPGISANGDSGVDFASIPFYVENDLVIDEANRLKKENIEREFEMMSTMNESCLVFNAAFYLVFAILGIIALVLFVRANKETAAI